MDAAPTPPTGTRGEGAPRRRSSVFIAEMKLDAAWYARRHAALLQALPDLTEETLRRHFRDEGDALGADPNPCFLLSHYMAVSDYADRAPPHGPCEDYLRTAGQMRWSAHWLFDEVRFQTLHPKVGDAVQKRNLVSGYVHFLRSRDANGLSPHPLFNAAFYARLAGLPPGANAFLHYLREGQFQALSPHPLFDVEHYLRRAAIPEGVGRDRPFTCALHHFVTEGIARDVPPVADFDAAFYRDRYPDVAEAIRRKTVRSAFEHFLLLGQREGRQPNAYFSQDDYLWYNPEVRRETEQAGLASPFEHFMAFGARRGLRAHRPAHAVAVPELHAKAIFEQRARITAQLALHEGLALPEAAEPRISFVIPVHDNFAFTLSLLAQLEREARAAPGIPVEVIVVDNGSTDRTREIGALVGGLRVLRTEARSGYTIACNQGAAAARGEILVFLNNDIELTPGLLPRILRSLADPAVGVAGARIVGAAGRLQEAGGLVFRDGSAAGLGRGQDPTLPPYLLPRDVDYVSGCFLCVRRALFEALGGFDARFAPGYYEDTDLCLRVRAHGLRVAYDPSLVIHHYEYASYSKGRPPSASGALMARKREDFVRKNRALLSRQPAPGDLPLPLLAFPPGSGRPPRVLLVADRLPGAAADRRSAILGAMTGGGMAVSVWAPDARPADHLPDWTRGAWSALPQIGGPQSLEELLRQQPDAFDLAWVCGLAAHRAFRAVLRQWRDARSHRRLVVDTGPLEALRPAALLERAGRPMPEPELLDAIRAETPDLAWADAVVAPGRHEAVWLERALGLAPAVLGHRLAVAPGPGFDARQGLLLLGDEAEAAVHPPLRWLVAEVLPKLEATLPGLRLTVAGCGAEAMSCLGLPTTVALDVVPAAADPGRLLAAARVLVAPACVAGGPCPQVELAAAHGLPAVAMPAPADRLREPDGGLFPMAAEGWRAEDFAAAVQALYTDRATWEAWRARGLRHAAATCDPARFDAAVREIAHG